MLFPCPLDTLIIAHFVGFVKRFFQLFLKKFTLTAYNHYWLGCFHLGAGLQEWQRYFQPLFPLLTIVFYHTLSQKSTGNVAQVSGKNSRQFCAKFLLTKLPGYGIMVNSARIACARAVKFRFQLRAEFALPLRFCLIHWGI